MRSKWIVGFPMYDFPHLQEAHRKLWAALRGHAIEAGVIDAPKRLTRDMHHARVWTHPFLLLGQACEYPIAKLFAGRVRVVATPRYRVEGCVDATYRSAVLVRKNDPAETLADLRDRRCVINERTSNSGMNLFRAAVAPIAAGFPFFASVLLSGSHRLSLRMVAAGDADVASVDCVTLGHLRRRDPAVVAALRVLHWTPSTPSLPFITSASTSDTVVKGLRAALSASILDPALRTVRQQLFLDGFDLNPALEFSEVLKLERAAVRLGYPELI